ncbi:hypothetical protein Poli38472_012877 [Pythium oligandrum]|uniref:Uncharacterized protein n=1 Tax=Pythium oligandrum TaxID=41045 RepID=A0A8K1CJ91_PYTOL|nr:hypothetical protein Poli38472_012877 [Pythium oligandrum]|eukprot:TMW64255.1 hypothetical protein Poli38472_012877 [Pythium oligandrum]
MAALFRGIVDTMTKSAPETTTTRKENATVVASPRSYHLPAYPMASEWDERHRSSNPNSASGAPLGRIAHWDKKREKCQNCKHIYLKTLSRHPGFCSVDCKSNAAYIDKVNRTIKAVRNAVEQLQQDKEEDEDEEQEQEQEEEASVVAKSSTETEAVKCLAPGQAHTFAEFGIETRLSNDQNVEWAFSAVY